MTYNKKTARYTPSIAEIEKAEENTRAIAREAAYDGYVECWFDAKVGKFHWFELVGDSYTGFEEDDDFWWVNSASTN